MNMKTEFATVIGVAILGTLIAYFVCNIFMGEINDFKFTTVDSSDINASLTEPDPEVFNFRAINPTVEVYVGEEED